MRWSVIGALAIALAAAAPSPAKQRAVRVGNRPPVVDAELPGCELIVPAPRTCSDGDVGSVTPQPFDALGAGEVQAIVEAAAAALSNDTATIAVVDRSGRPLALYRQAPGDANDDLALGVARTAAFASNSQAPLSSRTIRFISQVHFPPGVTNTPSGALYGIEQSNRGCDLNAPWNGTPAVPNQCVLRARSIKAFVAARDGQPDLPCNANDFTGCGTGLVTGKVGLDDAPNPQRVGNRPVRPGGIPLYRVVSGDVSRGIVTSAKLVGAIGVYGIDNDTDLEEYVAVTGAFGPLNANMSAIVPVSAYPLPFPENVFIDGIRLPFLGPDAKLRFNNNGLPIGLQRPEGTSAGAVSGTWVYGPYHGGCVPNGYLVGPKGGAFLDEPAVRGVVDRAVAAAKKTRAQVRLPQNSYARMVVAVADVDGTILALYRMPDTILFSIDVAASKARNMVYFNGSDARARADLPGIPAGTFLTTRTLGFGAQPFFPPGIDSRVFDPAPGPWYSTLFIGNASRPCSQGSQLANANQNGVTFFAGATALVRNGQLVGGLGISGDGIEQDDYVTYLGAGDLLPPEERWADRIKIDGARLPMFKFPRHPEGVTECGGGPCS